MRYFCFLILLGLLNYPEYLVAKVCTRDEVVKHMDEGQSAYHNNANSLSHFEVSKVFDCNGREIYQKYSNQLQNNKKISGKVFFTVVVLSNGSVDKVMSESLTVTDEKFLKELENLIKEFKFPHKTEGSTIRYPIEFKP